MLRIRKSTSQDSSWLPFCLLTCLALVGCGGQSDVALPANTSPTTGTVTVEVVNGAEKQSYEVTNVAAGATVESILRSMTEPEIVIQGSGVTAFVDRIGDTGTSTSEGWLYRVDGEFAKQGIGSTKVDPPTTITWSFGVMEP